MGLVDIEVGLTEQQGEIRDVAHKFAEEVMRPAGRELDGLADPAGVVGEGSVLWEVFEKQRELGLDDLEGATSEMSPAERIRLRCAISEEMGWGDSGLAISLAVAGFHKTFARMSGRPALVERFCKPGSREIGCWAITEPDHGSDSLAFSEPHFSDPKVKANCIARLEGDEYVIKGQKAAWVSNGTIADVGGLFCTIDGDRGFRGGGVAIVPLDLPGVSRGKPLDKLGQRALNQGEIFFDDVRIPAQYMVVGKEAYATVVELILTGANAGMGLLFVGVARAALEHALEYARERVQGGRPIIEHQSVKARLFKMFTQVEAARSLARRVALYNGLNPPGLLQYSIASKVFSTNTAFEVASAALQIYGGNGLSREYPIEKVLRDARASMIEDGCNEILSLVGASKL
jgi:alkylation response protein AidB-like acyl-CoA dehydrogenase